MILSAFYYSQNFMFEKEKDSTKVLHEVKTFFACLTPQNPYNFNVKKN